MIKVISSDKDGAELRRIQKNSPRYSRCSGTADDGQINDALANCKTIQYSGLGEAYGRIDWTR